MAHYRIWWVGKDYENSKILEWDGNDNYGEYPEPLHVGYDYWSESNDIVLLDGSNVSIAKKDLVSNKTCPPSDILLEREFPNKGWDLTRFASGTNCNSETQYHYTTIEEALSFVNDDEVIVCLDVHV